MQEATRENQETQISLEIPSHGHEDTLAVGGWSELSLQNH